MIPIGGSEEGDGALTWIAAAMLSALVHALVGLLILTGAPPRTVTAAPVAATEVELTDWLGGPTTAAVSAVSAAVARAAPARGLSHLAMHPLRMFRSARPAPSRSLVPAVALPVPQALASSPVASTARSAPAAPSQLPPLPGRPISVDTPAARNALQLWEAAMSQKLEHFKRYPEDSRQRHEEDTVSLRITVSRSGEVLRVSVLHSRGFSLLDQEALRMVQLAAPLPPLPEELSGDRINVIVPVEFFLVQGLPLSADPPR
ncbi:MAG TPA: energy transducer TonB [Steroidobacteraceae bacterium]|nr:energy transducer TonB [Steroidobacteraceae bacterium]